MPPRMGRINLRRAYRALYRYAAATLPPAAFERWVRMLVEGLHGNHQPKGR